MANAKGYGTFSVVRWSGFLLTMLLLLMTATPVFAHSVVHVVQPGESLSQIAVRYGVSQSALVNANGIGNSNYIYTGQQLVVPDGSGNNDSYRAVGGGDGYVTVGRGDSLSLIAALHGMTTATTSAYEQWCKWQLCKNERRWLYSHSATRRDPVSDCTTLWAFCPANDGNQRSQQSQSCLCRAAITGGWRQ
jgi:hypothetical protein